VQRGGALEGGGVWVGPFGQQVGDHFGLAGDGRGPQRGFPAIAVTQAVDRSARFDQGYRHGDQPGLGRPYQGGGLPRIPEGRPSRLAGAPVLPGRRQGGLRGHERRHGTNVPPVYGGEKQDRPSQLSGLRRTGARRSRTRHFHHLVEPAAGGDSPLLGCGHADAQELGDLRVAHPCQVKERDHDPLWWRQRLDCAPHGRRFFGRHDGPRGIALRAARQLNRPGEVGQRNAPNPGRA
jgi:hypothetical protein